MSGDVSSTEFADLVREVHGLRVQMSAVIPMIRMFVGVVALILVVQTVAVVTLAGATIKAEVLGAKLEGGN